MYDKVWHLRAGGFIGREALGTMWKDQYPRLVRYRVQSTGGGLIGFADTYQEARLLWRQWCQRIGQ